VKRRSLVANLMDLENLLVMERTALAVGFLEGHSHDSPSEAIRGGMFVLSYLLSSLGKPTSKRAGAFCGKGSTLG
jgi:hypothetical protein